MSTKSDAIEKREHNFKKMHADRHMELHAALDELVADWLGCTDSNLRTNTVMDLIIWSCDQTLME